MTIEETTAICGVLTCRKVIRKGDVYYLLGAGKVINCEECACKTKYKIVMNGKQVEMLRGWDKTFMNPQLRKTL